MSAREDILLRYLQSNKRVTKDDEAEYSPGAERNPRRKTFAP